MEDKEASYQAKVEENVKKWGSWLFNVRDKYKSMEKQEIIEDLSQSKIPCAILMQNLEGDFNISNIIRTANNFNVAEIFYYGKKRFDRRGACGSYHYSPIQYLSSLEDIRSLKQRYSFIALENNIEESVPMEKFSYPDKPLFILGEENKGVSQDLLDMADFKIEIPSRGSVRSLNVGTAAGIMIYDFYSKFMK